MIERTFQTAPEPVACPYLGLLEDDRTRFLFATPAHRCHVKRKPGLIDLQHQGRYCLSNEFAACPRFRAPTTKPAATARRVTSQQAVPCRRSSSRYPPRSVRRPVLALGRGIGGHDAPSVVS